jgi:hypothetical protein
MGLLDPKLDKARTFELLRKRGAVKAELKFQGGHDEGNVEEIILTLDDGETVELPTWYCGGYVYTDDGYQPMSTPANEDEELADLLEGPINERFGAWGSVSSTYGVLTWDVETRGGEVVFSYTQDVETEFNERVSF